MSAASECAEWIERGRVHQWEGPSGRCDALLPAREPRRSRGRRIRISCWAKCSGSWASASTPSAAWREATRLDPAYLAPWQALVRGVARDGRRGRRARAAERVLALAPGDARAAADPLAIAASPEDPAAAGVDRASVLDAGAGARVRCRRSRRRSRSRSIASAGDARASALAWLARAPETPRGRTAAARALAVRARRVGAVGDAAGDARGARRDAARDRAVGPDELDACAGRGGDRQLRAGRRVRLRPQLRRLVRGFARARGAPRLAPARCGGGHSRRRAGDGETADRPMRLARSRPCRATRSRSRSPCSDAPQIGIAEGRGSGLVLATPPDAAAAEGHRRAGSPTCSSISPAWKAPRARCSRSGRRAGSGRCPRYGCRTRSRSSIGRSATLRRSSQRSSRCTNRGTGRATAPSRPRRSRACGPTRSAPTSRGIGRRARRLRARSRAAAGVRAGALPGGRRAAARRAMRDARAVVRGGARRGAALRRGAPRGGQRGVGGRRGRRRRRAVRRGARTADARLLRVLGRAHLARRDGAAAADAFARALQRRHDRRRDALQPRRRAADAAATTPRRRAPTSVRWCSGPTSSPRTSISACCSRNSG